MLESCISYREQLLIIAGVVIISGQAILGWLERQYYRNALKRYRALEADIHDNDRT